MIFTCALSGVIIIANLYTWGVVLGALLLGPRARLNAAARRGAPALALRPEVHATTSVVSHCPTTDTYTWGYGLWPAWLPRGKSTMTTLARGGTTSYRGRESELYFPDYG